MSSINEAIFRGRIRRDLNTPEETLKRIQSPLTAQFMARKAIEAVLAGGYTTCAPARKKSPAAPLAPPPRHGITRDLILWIGIFALAGLIGIATSRLPGHAVKAKQASRAALAPPEQTAREEILKIAQPQLAATNPADVASVTAPPTLKAAAVAGEVEQAAPPAAPAPEVQAQPAPAPAPALDSATLLPVIKPAVLLAVAAPAPTVRETARPRLEGKMPQVPIDEVLYEGDPAPTIKSSPSPAFSAKARPSATPGPAAALAPRKTTPLAEPSAQPAAGESDASGTSPRVEGIFWDKVRPMALVNGDIVEVGSKVGDFKVMQIQPGLVVLSDGATRLDLRP